MVSRGTADPRPRLATAQKPCKSFAGKASSEGRARDQEDLALAAGIHAPARVELGLERVLHAERLHLPGPRLVRAQERHAAPHGGHLRVPAEGPEVEEETQEKPPQFTVRGFHKVPWGHLLGVRIFHNSVQIRGLQYASSLEVKDHQQHDGVRAQQAIRGVVDPHSLAPNGPGHAQGHDDPWLLSRNSAEEGCVPEAAAGAHGEVEPHTSHHAPEQRHPGSGHQLQLLEVRAGGESGPRRLQEARDPSSLYIGIPPAIQLEYQV
mmetsp:Transcript_21456/g.67973  ORF Transcript_21456/g.67973 Transcript_21456/m.67973 type:complete len:264 (-) Transcript_21456:115-906(-)